MARARSNLSDNVASLKRALAEKDALLAEKQALLIERDRVIAVRDAELYAKTLQIEHLKAQLAVLRRARFGRSSRAVQRYLLKAHGKEGFEAAEGGGVTVLGDCVGLVEAQDIVSEAAHSGEDAGIFSDA